jgi:hypothetical protein
MSIWAICLTVLTGYGFSIAIETPILLLGLSRRHSWKDRLFAGVWLTGCTYPIVTLVLPFFFSSQVLYVIIAETFAPIAESALFWLAFVKHQPWSGASSWRDGAVIVAANLASFGLGAVLWGI